jgi:hypothetical protein
VLRIAPTAAPILPRGDRTPAGLVGHKKSVAAEAERAGIEAKLERLKKKLSYMPPFMIHPAG